MRDGWVRRSVKAIARRMYELQITTARALGRLRGGPRFRLEGTCEGCGQCCKSPSLRVDPLTYHLRIIRTPMLAWQRTVNGFEFKHREREGRLLVFRCTHYDPETKRCDSYDSRPGICRDYPALLLSQPWPELFEECTHRLVSIGDRGLREQLQNVDLPDEAREELERKLRLR